MQPSRFHKVIAWPEAGGHHDFVLRSAARNRGGFPLAKMWFAERKSAAEPETVVEPSRLAYSFNCFGTVPLCL